MEITPNVVVPFKKLDPSAQAVEESQAKGRVTSKLQRLEQLPGEVAWPIQRLPGDEQCARWVDEYVQVKPYEAVVRSLWRNYPSARAQVKKLLSFIPPMWHAADGRPLAAKAMDAAGNRLLLVSQAEGYDLKPRLLGCYLWGLMSIQAEVGRLKVRGLDREGRVLHWEHFEQPLLQWARDNGMAEVMASARDDVSILWLRGMETTMLAAIAEPNEIGFMKTYAPLG